MTTPARPERLCPVCGGLIDARTRSSNLTIFPESSAVSHRSCLDGPDPTRPVPSNVAEHQALRELVSLGAVPCHTGYPDFWWVQGGTLCFLEVKPNAIESLKADQAAFVRAAKAQGCRVFRYSPTRRIDELLTERLAPIHLVPKQGRGGRAER